MERVSALAPSDPEPIALDRDLSIQTLRDVHEDYALMARWQSDARVLEFYGGRDKPLDLKAVYEKYAPRVKGDDPTVPCIIRLDGTPIGFMQYTEVSEGRSYHVPDLAGLFGIDLFIGEPGNWGRGLGTRALSLLVDFLFESKEAQKIVIDPQVVNLRAIRSYEKAGFSKVRVLPSHEFHEGEMRDAWLMEVDRSDWVSRRRD